MQWINSIVDELTSRHPDGEILIESGGTPSGTYHLGHMRELVICDAILLELRRRGRQARHIYFVDDLDNLRKIPINVPAEFEKYLGYPICDVPAPDGSDQSYADFFLQSLVDGCTALNIEVEFIRSHLKYREGYFIPAIERSLERVPQIRHALETVSGRQLDDTWSPIQVLVDKRLKKRPFIGIDTTAKTIKYKDAEGAEQTVKYDSGEVKLDWRLDWPGRWWLQEVHVEPSGRDHMTKGSSYDTGVQIMKEVYEADPPLPVAYDFINMAGDTKKMSASKGTGLDAVEGSTIMPPEVVRYYILKAPPLKRLYFDPVTGLVQLMDEFAEFAAKEDKSESEVQLWYLSTRGTDTRRSVSRIPFSHLVTSYQASLKDVEKTLEVIKRTEHSTTAEEDAEIIKNELKFIDAWLEKRAPEEVKFALKDTIDPSEFSDAQKVYLQLLAEKVKGAPKGAEGEWFHKAIYEFKGQVELEPKELFTTLYQVLIGKDAGPRAGWFLSLLPRDWLISRFKLER
jgi:lysyl-tRNA synthetase, class I